MVTVENDEDDRNSGSSIEEEDLEDLICDPDDEDLDEEEKAFRARAVKEYVIKTTRKTNALGLTDDA